MPTPTSVRLEEAEAAYLDGLGCKSRSAAIKLLIANAITAQDPAGGGAVGQTSLPSAAPPKDPDPYKWDPRVKQKNPPSVRPFSS